MKSHRFSPSSFLPRVLGVASLAGLAFAVTGCENVSRPFERSTPREHASTSVDKAAAEVAEINGRIDGALRALDELVRHPSSDLKAQYDTYADALNRLESSSEELRKRSSEMQTRGQDYFVNWDREIAAIHNENLRQRSAERREEVSERFDEIRASYVEARERLTPFVRRLNEIKTALSVDLTPGGVASVRPAISDLTDGAGPAREALRELAEDLRRANAALAPAAVRGVDGR